MLSDSVTGKDRRDAALAKLQDRRAALIRRGQRALLLRLLAVGTATADDVRASDSRAHHCAYSPTCRPGSPGVVLAARRSRRRLGLAGHSSCAG
jgi:hypothetical protein